MQAGLHERPDEHFAEEYEKPVVIAGATSLCNFGSGLLTLGGGLARRICDLFWPIAAEAAGFAHPDQPPVFLSLETSQYYMAHLVRPLLEQGYFESVTMDRNRLKALEELSAIDQELGLGYQE